MTGTEGGGNLPIIYIDLYPIVNGKAVFIQRISAVPFIRWLTTQATVITSATSGAWLPELFPPQ
jgi:hypothetical protein